MKGFISLKARILLSFGSLIVFLMLLFSLSVLYQWRKLIITNQIKNTEAIAQSFSFSVLDALIYHENGLQESEGYLQSYLSNFALHNSRLKYISVTDGSGKLTAHSDIRALSGQSHVALPNISGTQKIRTRIFKHGRLGWVIETNFPLRTGGKYWGNLQMAFNAEPLRHAIRNIFFLLSGLTTIGLILVLLLLFYFADRLTSSLSTLVKNMDRYDLQNSGDDPLPVMYDEIGYLMQRFEELKRRLRASRRKLISAQRQIYQAEKLASVGRLASGVAHEINNPLNGIKNCLYVLRRHENDPEQRAKYLPLIDEGLTHIETIVHKLLNFSRQDSATFRPVNLNKEIELVCALLEYRLKEKGIQIETVLYPDLPAIEADAQLMQEVLMNLLMNALDAVDNGGLIRLSTKISGPGQIELEVFDNGAGIPKKIIDTVFDPFFTTKEEGQGTGLGLSVSLGIVEAHNGSLKVKSAKNATSFIMQLPIERPYENIID